MNNFCYLIFKRDSTLNGTRFESPGERRLSVIIFKINKY